MATEAQTSAITSLHALGKSESEIAVVVGLEIGEIASIVGGATFTNPYLPLPASGAGQGASVVHEFPFTFDTPDLLTGALAVFTDGYTPAIGDWLLDAWVSIDTAWDGTTPLGDFGSFLTSRFGWFGGGIGVLPDMTVADNYGQWTDSLITQPNGAGTCSLMSLALLSAENSFASVRRGVPAKFGAADPVKICVSQDGTNTGADPGSTQGTASLYIKTATI